MTDKQHQHPQEVFQKVDFDPFSNTVSEIPTTEPQREIWTNIQLGGHAANCAYNESVSLHLSGELDMEAIRYASQMLFARHDALRSVFSADGMHLTILENVVVEIPLLDFSGLTDKEQKEFTDKLLFDEAEYDFDLEKGPLGKISVIKFSPDKFQLVLTFHHIVCDGWSLGIIMQDLSKLYSAKHLNTDYVDDPALSFSDYAFEESAYLNSPENQQTEAFWINQYKNNIPAFEIPVDKARPAIRTFNANRIDVDVDSNLVVKLKQVGAKHGASFVSTLVSAFEIFMYRISGNEDVVIGLPAAGQSIDGKQSLVGHCVNLLPLRSFVNYDLSFIEYIKSRKPEILDAYDHQHYTFGSLINKLNIPRDPSRIPLVPVSFNVDIGITNGVSFEGCSYSFSTNARHYENFEWFINAAGSGNELTLECTHNTDLFDSETVHVRMKEFIVMLEGIVMNPDSKISKLPILTVEENKKIFSEWNNNFLPYDAGKTMHRYFEEHAASKPDAIALLHKDNKLSYSELNSRSNQLAHFLIQSGCAKGNLIGICLDRTPEMIIAMLAILKSGGAYVPIDPSYPADRISFILEDAKAPFVITKGNAASLIPAGQATIINFDNLNLPTISSNPEVHLGGDDLAYIIYTSGSTGKPKGVAIEHHCASALFAWAASVYSNEEMDGVLASTSMCFDLSVFEIFNSLAQGGRIILVKDALELPSLNNDHNVRLVNTVPSAAAELLKMENGIPDTVTTINLAGEPLAVSLVNKLYQLPHINKVYDLYGPSEDTTYSTYTLRRPEVPATIGKILPNSTLYLLDKNMQPVPVGIPGEIYIGGDKLAREYLYRPELTAEKFIQDPFSEFPGARLYKTGDLARYFEDGNLEFLGRIDNQVKIRGFRIELGEIESWLEKHPDIKDHVVVARDDQSGDKRIVAYLVLHENKNLDVAALRDYLKKEIPEFMVPSVFVFMDAMPLTPNGKIDRKKLPAPDVSVTTTSTQYEEPHTPVEEAIANIWCNVLGLERIGIRDNFFELGGHSLIAVRMFNEIEKQLGIKVQLPVIFRAPTIEELAKIISKEESAKPWSCLVPLQGKGNKRPLFCIHMHNGNIHRWRVLVKHLGEDQPVYAIQPKGLDEKQKPHTSIEDMASYYIQIIKEVQPEGPYNLLGLCFSGMVVFEMAAQLEKEGEKVAFLGMVNNYAPPENATMYRVKQGINKFMKMEMGEMFQYALDKNVNVGKKLFRKIIPGAKLTSDQSNQQEKSADSVGNDLRSIHSLALLNYHPTHVYHGDLKIIRTGDPIEEFYNEFLGWDRLIKGSIDTYIINGCDNDTIITDAPYNDLLSIKVKEYLDSASVTGSSGRMSSGGGHGRSSAAVL